MRHPAACRPCSTVNHDDGRSSGGVRLHVRIERQAAGVRNVSHDPGHDVVALEVSDLDWPTRLRRGHTLADHKCEERKAAPPNPLHRDMHGVVREKLVRTPGPLDAGACGILAREVAVIKGWGSYSGTLGDWLPK